MLTATSLQGFWPESLKGVVPSDWSIAAEMMFYLFFPITILGIGSRARRYLWLAIAVYLTNVCVFKPWASIQLSDYDGAANTAFVEDPLHRFFLSQLPILLTCCFLFFTPFENLGLARCGVGRSLDRDRLRC